MPTIDVLTWVTCTLSFFNTVASLWLGLTVLLNAERRTWGALVIGGGLLFNGLFFVAHSAVAATGFGALNADLDFVWHAIWLVFVSHPFAWYIVIAWYTDRLHARRHLAWLFALGFVGLMAFALMVFANPLPAYDEFLHSTSPFLTLAGIPVVILVYPVYSVFCFASAIALLRRPWSGERFMGDLARKRARPWLTAASLVLLGVSLAIGGAAAWFIDQVQTHQITMFSPQMMILLTGFDLLISGLLAVVAVLVGQAIVSYEVFTGKVLPRGGLFRDWRNSLILAGGYGAVVGASFVFPIDPIYRVLLATVLMTVFYALLNWRSYLEREQSMQHLRPFVTSQRLYEHLLSPTSPLEIDAVAPLRALCDEILGARVVYLAAIGPLAPLVSRVLAYPATEAPPMPPLAGLVDQFRTPQTMCMQVDPGQYGGAVWAVPLWSERGLIGVLLLGEKRDGRLYAQEEIEIARTTGERLIDTQASAEMARRLMDLQRQRLAESQVLDRSTRRILHDDVLPRLHTALLTLSSAQDGAAETRGDVLALLADVHHSIANLMQEIPIAAAPEITRLGLIGTMRKAVDGELSDAFDSVTWQVEPEAERAARSIPALTAEVVFFAAREAVRNAAHHGRSDESTHPLHLSLSFTMIGGLQIAIQDDGVGLNAAGASTTGSGRGLALHSTMMAVIGGTLTAESAPGTGTRVLLTLPVDSSF